MSLGKLKAFLTLLMALGAVAYFGGDGTLASFSAETSNPGSTIASGTLTMSNKVNSGTACVTTTTATNINPSCDAPLTLTNVAPGVFGGVAQITVKNTGSIDASKLWLWAPSTTDCVDAKTTSSPVSGATFGTQLNFNTGASTNQLCANLLLYVQEIGQAPASGPSTTNSYCWFGAASSNGMCYAPISMYVASPVSAGSVSQLTVQVSSTNTSTALDGNIKSGDKLLATTPTGAQQQFTANGNQTIGQTTPILVNSTTSIALPAGTTITDLSTDPTGPIASLDAAAIASYSVSAFDSLHAQSVGPVQLTSVSTSGTLNSNPVAELPAGASRTFEVGVFLSSPTGSVQNTLQGLYSTFGLTWHIDQ